MADPRRFQLQLGSRAELLAILTALEWEQRGLELGFESPVHLLHARTAYRLTATQWHHLLRRSTQSAGGQVENCDSDRKDPCQDLG